MIDTHETKDQLDLFINNAYDYIAKVLKCQGRWLGNEDMYAGYRSVFPLKYQLSRQCFFAVYNEIKSLGHDNPSFFE